MTPRVSLRRGLIFGLAALTLVLGTGEAHRLVSANGLTFLEGLWLALFVGTFGWISLSFWTQVAGFLSLALKLGTRGLTWPTPEERSAPLRTRTAILMPVHNEDAVSVFAQLEAMLESLERTGHAASFDVYVLSDSTHPDAWVAEEREWAALCQRVGPSRVFYRKRSQNEGKKAGNIAHFCRRFGRQYESMVVLDADSLMTGETLVTMARLMEKNPEAGIIQAPPVALGAQSLFARLQQFAGRMYGAANAAGLAFWQVGESNYWGHNAIIRTKAFMEHCGLPVLPGQPPFGGHILSHDFVEAALVRRGGYTVWLVPELGGSYEQLPPTVLDYAARDRRWCQGNLQHLPLIAAEKLHWMSRVHFGMGVMAYASSLLCLLFLAVGFGVLAQDRLTEPQYFGLERSLFPAWKTFDRNLAVGLGVMSLALLLVPKLLGLLLHLFASAPVRRAFGGRVRMTVSFVLETVWSTLLASSMMLFQSTFVVATLFGHKVEWGAQQREGRRVRWEEAAERQGGHMVLGLALLGGIWAVEPTLLPWLSPLIAGLILSMALSVVSSSTSLGMRLSRWGLFLTPEESEPPVEALRANQLADARRKVLVDTPQDGLVGVVTDPALNAVHLSLLSAERMPRADPALTARAKARASAPGGLGSLSVEEKKALLVDPESLYELHLRTLGTPSSASQA